ncbi:monovalent cation:proton antiporter family protein [Alteromonas sp. C1M14]|uniref:monovalent cation:proton antiporter family protein n=1 Tax=Alteromonas sp. C1M14 TaxID=2841567 RepID=UPI001C097235|nr:monovalent cation:proton antiporter family protein [Alteromonas sp. C1M14]MBU2977880.1 cation:proton antiporter [Alteromonas sp. C1M14]
MALSVVSVAVFKKLHLPPILAYLFAGFLAGPDIFSLFAHPEDMHLLAEIGIVFLLFSLGLEFSLPKLMSMRSLVFGVGLGQMVVTTLAFSLIAYGLGMAPGASVIIGGMLALSSTAIVIKQFTEAGAMHHRRREMAISILLFQDLAVVPFLIAIPLMSSADDVSLVSALIQALVKGLLVVVILLSAGKWILPWVFREVAKTRTDELFVLTTILVAILAGGLTYVFGLSMALGAFLAGMMLGESQYKYQLEADIRPFRDILMGLFFATVGMQLKLDVLASDGVLICIGVVCLMALKTVLLRLVSRVLRCDPVDSWATGIKLCQIGEFSFVMAALATSEGVIDSRTSSVIISMGIISMALTPLLINRSVGWAKKLVPQSGPVDIPQNSPVDVETLSNHIIIAGFGRVGQSVSRLLKLENINYITIDVDPVRVHESRNAGESILFGDASQKNILEKAGAHTASLVLITFDEPEKAKQVISVCRKIAPKTNIMVRTKRDYQLASLYEAGASQVVPEIQEGNLMLISQVLHYAGVPMSKILRRVREERQGRYDHLHGFYPGETTEISYGTEDKLEFIHGVELNHNAAYIGKRLCDIDFNRMRVKLKGVRRHEHTIVQPPKAFVLQAADVVIIAGKPRRVERAERRFLDGH